MQNLLTARDVMAVNHERTPTFTREEQNFFVDLTIVNLESLPTVEQ